MTALRIAERWISEANHPVQKAVLARVEDTDWAVRRQLAATLGALPAGAREDAIVTLLERHASDPVTMDAALSGLRGSELATVDVLAGRPGGETPERAAVMSMLAAMLVRSAEETGAQALLEPSRGSSPARVGTFRVAARRRDRAAQWTDARQPATPWRTAACGRERAVSDVPGLAWRPRRRLRISGGA